MIVNIDKNERDTIAEVCAMMNCVVNFYTDETNPLILKAEIVEFNGGELSARDAWYIGRSVAWSIAADEIRTLPR